MSQFEVNDYFMSLHIIFVWWCSLFLFSFFNKKCVVPQKRLGNTAVDHNQELHKLFFPDG